MEGKKTQNEEKWKKEEIGEEWKELDDADTENEEEIQ